MATSEPDIKTKITGLRHEILSYKPGKAAPCYDELVVFPDRLVIGVLNHASTDLSTYNPVPALRRALHGDVEATKDADRRETSTEGQEEYLTDSISVIERNLLDLSFELDMTALAEKDVKDLAAKVGCFMVLTRPPYYGNNTEAVMKINEITGRYPIVGLWHFSELRAAFEEKRMREEGIVEVYEIPTSDQALSDKGQLQLLHILHRCLKESDAVFAVNNLKQLYRNTSLLYERAQDFEATEAKQKMTEEIRRHERVEESLQQEMKKLQMKLEESSASREFLVNDNARLKNEIVCEKEKREQAELAVAENDKMAKNSQEMYKQREAEFEEALKAKEQKIKALEDKCKEGEETARCEVDQMKKEKEEERAKAAQLKEDVETNQQRVNSLAKLVEEKEQNEASLKQQVNCLEMKIEEERARFEKENLSVESALKNELKSEKERVEQFERETWKLRTKILLESEIRSEEQKKKAETPQWMKRFISWMASPGNQMQSGPDVRGSTSSEDHSREALEESDGVQEREEIQNDEFADILNQIADSLSKNAEIDSLGGQLSILQGDIDRFIMTNHRYHQITSDGTREMLKQWRKGVRKKDERNELRRALLGAKMINLADTYLPTAEASKGSGASDNQRSGLDDGDHDDVAGATSTEGSMARRIQRDQRVNDDNADVMDGATEEDDVASEKQRALHETHSMQLEMSVSKETSSGFLCSKCCSFRRN